MLTLNLSSLGITEEALTNAVLRELNISREEAVKQIADKLGVPLQTASSQSVKSGDRVQTDQGEAKAKVLTRDEAAILARAGEILTRTASFA